MAFKYVVFCAFLAVAQAGNLAYSAGHLAAPLAYSAGIGPAAITTYAAAPVVAKAIAAPVATSYSTSTITKSIAPVATYAATPVVAKTIAAPALAYSAGHIAAPALAYSSGHNFAAPALTYSAGHHIAAPAVAYSAQIAHTAHVSYSAPALGYATNYGW